MSNTRLVYGYGHSSNNAYLIQMGKIQVEFPYGPPLLLKDATLLAGTIEHLLAKKGEKVPTRLFSLSVSSDATLKRLSFDSMNEIYEKYESGIAANTFLALLIDHTNKAFVKLHRELPQTYQQYEKVAKLLATLVQGLMKTADITRIGEIERIVSEYRSLRTYKEGALLLREVALGKFTLDPSPPSRYVQQFQKDAFLCRQNDTDQALYVLLSGAVGVMVRGKFIAHITQPGEAFGELSLFLRGKRTADLVAEQKTAIFRLTPDDLPQFHNTHPRTFMIIAQTLAQRFASNLERLSYLASIEKSLQSNSLKDKELLSQLEAASKELALLQQQIMALKRFSNIPELNTFINREDLEPLEP